MRRPASLAVLLAVAALPAAAGPLESGGGCGGNAYSSATVTEGRGPRRGPLTAVPDTLCADIETAPPQVRIDLYGTPARDGSASGLGGGARRAPYGLPARRGGASSSD
ncbi:hypothetical protein [uncultured Methylobacterium sp.]|uniref:hypothetical protein n=1 Tax=uncultured Methylobacterium sp. TaxID=157278 RepID=UPI0035CB816A